MRQDQGPRPPDNVVSTFRICSSYTLACEQPPNCIANDKPPTTETLFNKPYEDYKRMPVADPFTIETLQNYEPISSSPEVLAAPRESDDDLANFEDLVYSP